MQTNWCPWRDTWNQSLLNDSLLSAQLLALLGLKSCCFQALGVGAYGSASVFLKKCLYLFGYTGSQLRHAESLIRGDSCDLSFVACGISSLTSDKTLAPCVWSMES